MSGNIKILIVEDEKIVALDLKRRLTKLGYQVTGMAASGEKALALVDQELPNIVLMDIHIQGNMDGIETADRLQKTHSIPIIYLTAYSEEKTVTRAKTTKPYGYILKPFSDRELHIIIQVSIERFENDFQLKKNEEHFRLALEAARLGTWEVKNSHEIFMCKNPNGNIEPITNWQSFFLTIDDNDKQNVTDFINKLRDNKGSADEIEFRVHADSNKTLWYKLYGKAFATSDATVNQIVGVLQETTESRLTKDRLAQAATVFKYAAEGIVILNKNRQFSCANTAFYSITELKPHHLRNKELPFLTSKALGDSKYEEIWQNVDRHDHWCGEISTFKRSKETMHAWLTIGFIPAKANEEQQYVVMISDITVIRETQEQLSNMAYYDSLTKLPNRMLIMDRLQLALSKATRNTSILGVLFIDLDNFKLINDTQGHAHGDSMLCYVAHRMTSILRQSDTLGRLGGDEFIVIVPDIESNDALVKVAEKILDCLSQPVVINNMEIVLSCSIGISVYPDHSKHHDDLVQMADTAMYEAKNKGRNSYAFYHPSLTQKAVHYLTRERELHHALIKNEFVLHYQPQYSLSQRRVTGVEALIRWQHPVKGLLSPAEIIPVAETSRLIVEIGNWILMEACKQLAHWRAEGFTDLRIAVNISIRQLADKHLQQLIAELLKQYDLPARLLELEVTESCLQNEVIYISNLEQLENLGIPISIDDFGTGYSCLSSLKNLPIRRLKIDQSFVKGIPHDSNDCAIAAAILAMAQKLNLQVTAEGIEIYDQAFFLGNLGCQELQGYLLSKPVPAERIPYLIRKLPDRIDAFNI
ncbi:two-component system response regulator [Nitrosomonas sp. wSCUT-2]